MKYVDSYETKIFRRYSWRSNQLTNDVTLSVVSERLPLSLSALGSRQNSMFALLGEWFWTEAGRKPHGGDVHLR